MTLEKAVPIEEAYHSALGQLEAAKDEPAPRKDNGHAQGSASGMV
jgi:hypothetical protein